jgi:hypothetical protein
MEGGSLPGDRPDARLVELTEPYVTDLAQLDDLIKLAKQHGYRGMKLSQGRALMATHLPTAARRWGSDHKASMRAMDSTRQRAIKRAGIESSLHHIKGVSADTASRSPTMAPWSIYPFSPEDCAAVICDLLVFETILSVDHLAESIKRTGLRAEVLFTPASMDVGGDMDVLRMHWQDRALTLHAPGLSLLLYELCNRRRGQRVCVRCWYCLMRQQSRCSFLLTRPMVGISNKYHGPVNAGSVSSTALPMRISRPYSSLPEAVQYRRPVDAHPLSDPRQRPAGLVEPHRLIDLLR